MLGDSAAFERTRGNLQQHHNAVLAEISWLRGMRVEREAEMRVDIEVENVELLGGRQKMGSTGS